MPTNTYIPNLDYVCTMCSTHCVLFVLKIPRFNCFVLLQTCDLCCGVALLLIHIAFIRTIMDHQVSPVYYHSNQSMHVLRCIHQMPSQTDVAPWCYKCMDWMGLGWISRWGKSLVEYSGGNFGRIWQSSNKHVNILGGNFIKIWQSSNKHVSILGGMLVTSGNPVTSM